MKLTCVRMLTLTLGVTLGVSSTAWGVPYASGVRDLGGDMWEFVLNESASSIRIDRDGGNSILISSPTSGRHTFDMTGYSSFEIAVDNSAAEGWTRISDSGNLFTNFERPSGLVVNNDPTGPYFGTIYVNNARTNPTVSGREMGDGLYSLTADRIGVDLANNFSVVTNANDPSLAKAPGYTVDQSINSSYRITLDDSGSVILGDYSDASGGLKYASPDLTTGGLVLDIEDGPTYGVPAGSETPIHGSISSRPYVTGSLGTDLVVYAVDEDLESVYLSEEFNNIWRWDVGAATNYAGAPQLIVNATNVDDFIGFAAQNASMEYSPVHDKWYMTEYRYYGSGAAGLAVVTADGGDGNAPITEWSSLQFTLDNGMDGWTDDPDTDPGTEGPNDVFVRSQLATVSPDGTKLFLHRNSVVPSPHLGSDSPSPGAVLVIPLDENGLPIIEIDDNDTPGDTSDDIITNFESIEIANSSNFHSQAEVRLDAAGNLYTTNSSSELFEVWSPGGNTRATTTSAGAFSIETLSGVNGDFNGDGFWDFVDIDDLTAAVAGESTDLAFDMNGDGVITEADITDADTGWLAVGGANNSDKTGGNAFIVGDANLDGGVDVSDFNEWNGAKFTETAAWSSGDFNADGNVDVSDFNLWNGNKFTSSMDGVSAVPEPHSLLIVLMAVAAVACRRKK